MRCLLVFAHGAGRAGADAWPEQVGLGDVARFVTFPGYGDEPPRRTDANAWVERLLATSAGPVHVIAHSYGAIPALLAAARRPGWCRSMTLFEPALYGLARGTSSVEQHIDRMTPVLALADSLGPATFWQQWMSALTGSEPDPVRTTSQLQTAERLRLLAPPWSIPVPSDVVAQVPTLVVTADWNAEYEDIATALTRLGATHRLLPGKGHRLVDDPRATRLLRTWAADHDDDRDHDDGLDHKDGHDHDLAAERDYRMP